MRVYIGIKSDDIYKCHTSLDVDEIEFKEIKENKIIPEKYLIFCQDFIDYIKNQSDSEKIVQNITEVVIFYEENGKEQVIKCCDSMVEYFNQ